MSVRVEGPSLKSILVSFPQLHALGGALRTHKKPPENTNLDFNPILQTLSRQWQTQVDEVTALIMASEACMGRGTMATFSLVSVHVYRHSVAV